MGRREFAQTLWTGAVVGSQTAAKIALHATQLHVRKSRADR